MTLKLDDRSLPLRATREGSLRIGETRVLLESVVDAHQRGLSPTEIRAEFPTLRLADIYRVIAFYLDHQEEVDAYLEGELAEFDRARGRQKDKGIRARLSERATGLPKGG